MRELIIALSDVTEAQKNLRASVISEDIDVAENHLRLQKTIERFELALNKIIDARVKFLATEEAS